MVLPAARSRAEDFRAATHFDGSPLFEVLAGESSLSHGQDVGGDCNAEYK